MSSSISSNFSSPFQFGNQFDRHNHHDKFRSKELDDDKIKQVDTKVHVRHGDDDDHDDDRKVSANHRPVAESDGKRSSFRSELADRFRMEVRELKEDYKEDFQEARAERIQELREDGVGKRGIDREIRELRKEYKSEFLDVRNERLDEFRQLGSDIKDLRKDFREEFREARKDLIQDFREEDDDGSLRGLRDDIKDLRNEYREQFQVARQELVDNFFGVEDGGDVEPPPVEPPPPPVEPPPPPPPPVEPPPDEPPPVDEDPGSANDQITASQVAFNALEEGADVVTQMEVLVDNAASGQSFDADQFSDLQGQLQQQIGEYQQFVGTENASDDLLGQLEALDIFNVDLSGNSTDFNVALDLLDDAADLVTGTLQQYTDAGELAFVHGESGATQTTEEASSSPTVEAPTNNNLVVDEDTVQTIVNLVTQQLLDNQEAAVQGQANISPSNALSLL